MTGNVAAHLGLMLVTDDRLLAGRDPVDVCRQAVQGGVTCIQLRLKHSAPRELVTIARALVGAVPVPVVVNDRLDVALAAGTAGVHLGPDDLPVGLARRMAPAGFWIGASVGNPGEAALGWGADYWGVGPWRATPTKADAGPALGEEGFRAVLAASGGVPCIAIGGIRPEDVAAVRKAGGAGVAVVSGILAETDVAQAAGRYRSLLTAHRSP